MFSPLSLQSSLKTVKAVGIRNCTGSEMSTSINFVTKKCKLQTTLNLCCFFIIFIYYNNVKEQREHKNTLMFFFFLVSNGRHGLVSHQTLRFINICNISVNTHNRKKNSYVKLFSNSSFLEITMYIMQTFTHTKNPCEKEHI